ncbi:MAG: hypothetical protein PHY12_12205, partial [Eubacteriales bacterium]|nr:hypothetical protein [Eubacteriales bacterium]
MSDHSGEPSRVGYFPEEKTKAAHRAEPRAQEAPRPRRRINPLRLALLIACAAVFVTCAALLISYGVDLLRANRASEELRSVYHAAENQPPAETEAAAPLPIESTAPPQQTEEPQATDAPQAAAATAEPAQTVAPASASGLYPGNPSLHIRDEFTALRRRNKDIIGWLTI